MPKFVLSIDQSTSGTKALLFDDAGRVTARRDALHRQLVDERGWVEHDPDEIFQNLLTVVKELLASSGINPRDIVCAGISNQRETALAWNRTTGAPVHNAIVWQCNRGEAVCQRLIRDGKGEAIRQATGIPVSPYYSAAKWAWILENVPEARALDAKGELVCSTIDSWVVFKLCGGEPKTDYSNASRTQLFNVFTLQWDPEVSAHFGIRPEALPRVVDSNTLFGMSDFGGALPSPIPVHGVLGDSHGALYGQGCLTPGAIKATYGTGSSVMMNIGDTPVLSDKGIVTSLAWGIDGKATYVLEGNMNYTGAVIRWLVDDLGLIEKSRDAGTLAAQAKDIDGLYLVPAFSGLGAPYWDGSARGIICGLTRGVGKREIVRAAEECIGYQIAEIIALMEAEASVSVETLKVDGGATRDAFLMQFQADITDAEVAVPAFEELSASGPAYLAGMALGLYSLNVVEKSPAALYKPAMKDEVRKKKFVGWRDAVGKVLTTK